MTAHNDYTRPGVDAWWTIRPEPTLQEIAAPPAERPAGQREAGDQAAA